MESATGRCIFGDCRSNRFRIGLAPPGYILGEKMTVFELHVAKDDVGKVIGKQGQTARAIRVLLNATATKLKQRAILEIIEE